MLSIQTAREQYIFFIFTLKQSSIRAQNFLISKANPFDMKIKRQIRETINETFVFKMMMNILNKKRLKKRLKFI